MEEGEILFGVCCEYCLYHMQDVCPVKIATNWSKWSAFCSKYKPNPECKDAKKLELKFERIFTVDALSFPRK